MQGSVEGRSRPLIDRVALIFVIVCLGIGVVRLASVVVAIPYTVVMRRVHPPTVAARSAHVPTLVEQLRSNPFVVSWWGIRPVPYPVGGYYLDVVSRHLAERTLGSVIGVVAEQDRKMGVPFKRVIVPSSRTLLYGEPAGLLQESADGTLDRTDWGSLAHDSAPFSDVPVVRKKYNPVLTMAQYVPIASTAHLVHRSGQFWVGSPGAGDSGTMILLVHITDVDREYLLVPLESSPFKGAF